MSLITNKKNVNSYAALFNATPFASFWMAGYEGADHVNGAGTPLSMNDANQHSNKAYEDYALLSEFGFRTVRESIGWRLVEQNGHFDFSTLLPRLKAAITLGLQINWTFCHYGWPADIDPYSPSFVERFAQYCRHAVTFLAEYTGDTPIYSPINEISFACWAAAANKFACLHAENDGGARLKRQLVRATLRASDEIWSLQPNARILQCDPLIHVGAPDGWPGVEADAHRQNLAQYEAWDMICGELEPELGGAPHYLDMLGINYYHDNQWGVGTAFPWHLGDQRRMPFHRMIKEVYERYQRPLVIGETSHVGSGRGAWIREIAQEAMVAKQHGVAIEGLCIYPTIDRPDWDNEHHWHHSGIWDITLFENSVSKPSNKDTVATQLDFQRIPCMPYVQAIHNAQRLTNKFLRPQAYLATPKTSTKSNLQSKGNNMSTIFVFSHLRWNFVFQRPQHLLSRLAEHYRINFIEEPVYDNRDCFLATTTPVPNVTVYTPHVPVEAHGFHDDYLPYLKTLIADLVVDYEDYLVWFYTPMALPLLQGMNPTMIVYDCMDELSAFANPPKQLLQRENALLGIADIVFTGGPSLYNAKRERHPNVHCFPSSVDVVHFQQALDRTNGHPAQHAIGGPKLGFYGVIDERFDVDIIAYLAEAHPEWQIVLVGPVVKINPSILPRHPNIHYIDQQPYQALPQLLAGWDVCLLPFALNESTRFISPTKTLEYMAAELPVVSTPIKDVIDLYGSAVAIADTPQAFVAACEKLLAETAEEKMQRIAEMRALVAKTSWERTATSMHELLQSSLTKPKPEDTIVQKLSDYLKANDRKGERSNSQTSQTLTSGNTSASASQNLVRMQAQVQDVRNVIVGAGPTGLSAAYHLGEDTVLIDKNPHVGGWCRSIQDKGFTFDYAGHIMFSNDEYVLQLYKILLGDNIHWQNREAWVYSKGVHTRYPFQGALYGLPPDVIKECIVGAVEARYGASKEPAKEPATCSNASVSAATKEISDCCADGTVTLPAGQTNQSKLANKPTLGAVNQMTVNQAAVNQTTLNQTATPANFEEFIYKVWGRGIAKHFAIPYNKKIWTVPLTEMETSWLGGRVPLPDIEEIISGALEPVGTPMGPNARFGYPLRGGFQAIMNGFLPHIKGEIELNADVVQISPKKRIIALADGRRYRYENLISTMPLPQLVRMIGDEAPQNVIDAAEGLKHISIRCVNLGVARENITDKHWIYYPEDSIFHRIFVQGNASPGCNPPGGFGLTCEISYSPWKPLPLSGQELIERCFQDCIKVGLLTENDTLITASEVDMPYAYVVYDHARARNVATVKQWLALFGITLAGRYSEWEYYNSDHAFLAGKKAAEAVESATHQSVPAV